MNGKATTAIGNGHSNGVQVAGQAQVTDVLHTIDSRTGVYQAIPIVKNSVNAAHFKQFKAPKDTVHPEYQSEQGIRVYDPGFTNTAVSESKITYVDGHEGVIQYRGYNLDDVFGKKKWIDTCHLLIWGHWPTEAEAEAFQKRLNSVPMLEQSVVDCIRSFPKNGSIVGMMIAGLSALQSCDTSAIPASAGLTLYLGNPARVDEQVVRILQSFAMIAAVAYCHATGRDFAPPRPDLSYIENFMLMTGHVDAATGLPSPRYARILERLWVLVADHEMTCSTAALLQTASSLPDGISALVSALAAAHGPLHGGAIEVAYRQIEDLRTPEQVRAKIAQVKAGKERLYGYGHRLYRVTDPRFQKTTQILDELADESARDPLLKTAFELDRLASEDEYFISRKLRPNADLLAAFAYKAIGFPAEFILPICTVSRTQGFMAHWKEAMEGQPKIWRPGQIYVGDINKKME